MYCGQKRGQHRPGKSSKTRGKVPRGDHKGNAVTRPPEKQEGSVVSNDDSEVVVIAQPSETRNHLVLPTQRELAAHFAK